jgi:hypothetical protein
MFDLEPSLDPETLLDAPPIPDGDPYLDPDQTPQIASDETESLPGEDPSTVDVGLLAESLVVLGGVLEPKVTRSELSQAKRLPREITTRLKAWLSSEKSAKFVLPPDVSLETVSRQLSVPPSGDSLMGWTSLSNAPDDPTAGAVYTQKLEACRKFLVDSLPSLSIPVAGGLLDVDPPEDVVEDFLSLFEVVKDFRKAIDLLEQGSFLPMHSDALEACHPDAYAFMRRTLFDLMDELEIVDVQDHIEVPLRFFLRIPAPAQLSPETEQKGSPEDGHGPTAPKKSNRLPRLGPERELTQGQRLGARSAP